MPTTWGQHIETIRGTEEMTQEERLTAARQIISTISDTLDLLDVQAMSIMDMVATARDALAAVTSSPSGSGRGDDR